MTTPIDRFRAWMDDTGLTNKAAAAVLGCDPSFISHVANGKRRPGLPLAVAIERETALWSGGPILPREWEEEAHPPIVAPATPGGE
jgi:hypothetical protein